MKRTLLILLTVVLAFVLGTIFKPYLKSRRVSTTGTETQLPPENEAVIAQVVNDAPAANEMATITDSTDSAGPFRVTGSVDIATAPSEIPKSALVRPDPNLPPLTYRDPSPAWLKNRMDAERKQQQTNQ